MLQRIDHYYTIFINISQVKNRIIQFLVFNHCLLNGSQMLSENV